MEPNFASYHIRKWYAQADETLINETGKPADGEPVRKFVIACVVKNPYAGAFSEDLSRLVEDSAKLGEEFGRRLLKLADSVGDGVPIQSYGKSCIVGVDGEYEHGNALLTTSFANPVRDAIGGAKAWIPSTGKRGGPGTEIDIPLAHKDALYVRSHYDTITTAFGDAPDPDEIVVIMGACTRGRLHARLGGLQLEDVEGENGLT